MKGNEQLIHGCSFNRTFTIGEDKQENWSQNSLMRVLIDGSNECSWVGRLPNGSNIYSKMQKWSVSGPSQYGVERRRGSAPSEEAAGVKIRSVGVWPVRELKLSLGRKVQGESEGQSWPQTLRIANNQIHPPKPKASLPMSIFKGVCQRHIHSET